MLTKEENSLFKGKIKGKEQGANRLLESGNGKEKAAEYLKELFKSQNLRLQHQIPQNENNQEVEMITSIKS